MDFYINKNATLPILTMELIKDGRYTYTDFHDKIQNSNITFCMHELTTGKRRIGGKDALCVIKNEYSNCGDEEYYLGYQFSERDTSKAGTFIGEFTIEFLDDSGTLIVPIREELRIHILEGSIKK